jgi:hypothetical protein
MLKTTGYLETDLRDISATSAGHKVQPDTLEQELRGHGGGLWDHLGGHHGV